MERKSITIPCCPPDMANVEVLPTVQGIRALRNTFVYVTSINTVFFVDNQRRITTICAMPIYHDNYDYQTNPLNLRSQTVYDFKNNLMIVYAPTGAYRLVSLIGADDAQGADARGA